MGRVDASEGKVAFSMPEETVVIDVTLEGKPWEAILDSGAALPFIDIKSLKQLNLLRTFDNILIQELGTVHLKLSMGKIEALQRFVMVEID